MQIEEERIMWLKQRTLNEKRYLGVDRLRIVSDYLKQSEESDIGLLRAGVFQALCEQMPLCIDDKEIIVGALGSQINTAQLYAPESSIAWLQKELPHLQQRSQDPFTVKKKDEQQILRWMNVWDGKTLADEIERQLSKEARNYIDANVFFIQKDIGYGHCLADYEVILKYGFSDMVKQTDEKIQRADNQKQRNFYKSILIVLHAAMHYIERYSEYAHTLALQAEGKRKIELQQISARCHKLVVHRAQTFCEALQCVWFLQLLIHLESDGTGVSFGRLDQYLYPHYRYSLEQGESLETMQKLLDMFWIKTNHLLKCRSSKSASLWSGYIMNQNVTIGGTHKNGRDACNEVTRMCLKSQHKLVMKEPQFSLRVHEELPNDILQMALDCIRKGGGKPQFVSDKNIMHSLIHMGVDREEVWDYAIIGCIEPSLRGGFNRCKSGHINLPKLLELTLYDGVDPITKKQIGPHTGHFTACKDFEAFYKAFEQQFDHMLQVLTTIHRKVTHALLNQYLPHPFLSMLTRGCMEKGSDITAMGAEWNWTSFSLTGIANLVDSMYVIWHEVFQHRHISPARLLEALHHNFEGYEELQKTWKELAKYGNADSEVDAMATRISTTLYETASTYRGHGDTPVCFGYVTVTKSVSMGRQTGALPDGRYAFTPFADGISPTHGNDRKGPLAVLKSTEALHLQHAAEGAILNQKFLPSLLTHEKAKKEFAVMLKTYLTQMEGLHIQYNMVSKETLTAAQKHPEQYKDLLVRVSGYSAYFVELSKEVQQDVMERTQYE